MLAFSLTRNWGAQKLRRLAELERHVVVVQVLSTCRVQVAAASPASIGLRIELHVRRSERRDPPFKALQDSSLRIIPVRMVVIHVRTTNGSLALARTG
jgi:hypothetical protein